MGSYHGTCGVTNLPIEEGDEVVLFVVENASSDVNFDSIGVHNSDAFFHPVSPPIRAVYKDYGRYSPVRDGGLAARIFLGWIGKISTDFENISNWIDFEKKIGDGHSVPGKEFDANSGEFEKSHKQVFVFPIHAKIYEKIVSHVLENEETKSFLDSRMKSAMAHAKLHELVKLPNPEEEFGRAFLESNGFTDTNFPLHEIAAPAFALKGKNATLEDVPSPAIEFVAFRMGMDAMRKTFAPLNGLGSQVENYDLHRDVGALVLEHAQKKLESQKEAEEKFRNSSIQRMI